MEQALLSAAVCFFKPSDAKIIFFLIVALIRMSFAWIQHLVDI